MKVGNELKQHTDTKDNKMRHLLLYVAAQLNNAAGNVCDKNGHRCQVNGEVNGEGGGARITLA